jgi:uncharacterized membrane protein (DUF4010 family)
MGQTGAVIPEATPVLINTAAGLKMELSTFVGGLRPEEIRSAVLLGLEFVIRPVLPNRFWDPWQLLTLAKSGLRLSIIVVAGIGFVNYALLRV